MRWISHVEANGDVLQPWSWIHDAAGGNCLLGLIVKNSRARGDQELFVMTPSGAFGFFPDLRCAFPTHTLTGIRDYPVMAGSYFGNEQTLFEIFGVNCLTTTNEHLLVNSAEMDRFRAFLNDTLRRVGGDINIRMEEIVSEPDYPPYEEGTIVYLLRSAGKIRDDFGPGKILKRSTKKSRYGDYHYTVEFIKHGTDGFDHKELVPAKDSFDALIDGSDCYRSKFDCGGLFKIGEPFLLRDGYLYNRGNTIILRLQKFNTKFINNATVQQTDNKAEEV